MLRNKGCNNSNRSNKKKRGTRLPKQPVAQRVKNNNKKQPKGRENIRADKFLLANLEPFDDQAFGAKVPDSSTYPTLALHSSCYTVLANTAGGFAAMAFYPSLAQMLYAPGTIAATLVWAAGTSYSGTDYATLGSVMSQYRVVGGGLKIRCIESMTAAKGTLTICHAPWDISGAVTGISQFPTTRSTMLKMPLADQYSVASITTTPVFVPFRRTDAGSERYRYQDYPASASPYAETAPGWAAIILFAEGVTASISGIEVEVVLHIEAIQAGVDTLLTPTAAAPPNTKSMDRVYSLVGSSQSSHHSISWADRFKQYAYTADEYSKKYTGKSIVGNVLEWGTDIAQAVL